ncbi:MAG: hypothetical protein PVG22_02780 [Chromatiales bacterium]|jgi:hypothetical protein
MRDSEETTQESTIPLLDEVVDPQELKLHALTNASESSRRNGKQKRLLEILQKGITAQLSHDLQSIVTTAVAQTVEQVTEQVRQLLQDELNSAIEEHLRLLIETEVAKEMKKIRP